MTPKPVTLLRPGYLVSLKTAIRGGVTYQRTDLPVGEMPAPEAPEVDIKRWETLRLIADREEYARAVELRTRIVGAIRRVTVQTSFGMLCPLDREDALDEQATLTRDLADEWNRNAKYSRVYVYLLRGRIAESDEESTRAIANEVRELLDEMESGVRQLDVPSVRDAARRARELAKALDAQSAGRMGAAITAARDAARAIVRRVEKEGEAAAEVLAQLNLGPIAAARFAVLDLLDPEPALALPGVEVGRFAGLDLSEDPYRPSLPVAASALSIELDEDPPADPRAWSARVRF